MAVVSRYVPVDLRGRRVVVVGAGIAGLASALALGERGAEVVLVEVDAAPAARTPEDAFFHWSRKRVPQSRHSHAFLARLRSILVRAYPEFLRELLDAGAVEIRLLDYPPPAIGPIPPEPGDEDLVTIACRRTTFEWVLRRHVEARPWLEVVSGAEVDGLVAAGGRAPGVRGVRVSRGRKRRTTIGADLVVDASGRASEAPSWLEAIGAPRPEESRTPSAILYYTRFYRRRPGRELPPPGDEPTLADLGWVKYAIFPGDDGVYSITFAAHVSAPRLKVLQHAAAFEELALACPGLVPYADPELGEPLRVLGRDVLAMGGLENRLRRFVDAEGRPLARGFFAIGDSAYHTNPLYGRGTSQAFMHASLLGEALDAAAGDVERAAFFLDDGARAEIEPFYRASVVADDVASRKVGAAPRTLLSRFWDAFFDGGVVPGMRCDATIFRTFVRVINMLDTPERAFTRPDVIGHVFAVLAKPRAFRERFLPHGPDRERMMDLLEDVARVRPRLAAEA